MTDRVLVTGGAGFIGSHLIERLIAADRSVTCLDNFDAYYPRAVKQQNIARLSSSPLVEFVEADILDEQALSGVFTGDRISTVVHLAARPGVRPSLVDPAPYATINVQGTVNVLRTAVAHSVDRIVFASSSSVYGSISGQAGEGDAPSPLSPYAASKVAGEAFCQVYAKLSGIPTIMLRFFTAYGPRQRPDMAVAKFVEAIEHGREITLFGDGKSKRDYTYIDDVIDGVEKAITCDLTGLQVFNLGSARPVQLLELVGLLEERLGKLANIRFAETGAGEPEITFADVTAAADALGYAPRISIEEGLSRFVNWFREGSHAMAKAV